VADAAAAAAAAREARLWNAHVALVEKRDEEAKALAALVDERDAYEAANRALATRVARLDKEAAERDAREREIADELAAARRRHTRCKDAMLFVVAAAASAAVGSLAIVARR
jgi:tryptophan 2,3-dioxygenase